MWAHAVGQPPESFRVKRPSRAQVVLGAASLSMLFALGGALAVLVLWYPAGTWRASGLVPAGLAVLCVHLAFMPLYTIFWINQKKAYSIMLGDVICILLIQLSAGLYGLSVLAEGRPVAMVFSVDRIVLVTANSVRLNELALLSDRHRLRWSGPLPLFASRASTDEERLSAIQLAMAGYDLAQRPSYWIPIDEQAQALRARWRHVADWRDVNRQSPVLEEGAVRDLYVVPLETRSGDWMLLMDSRLNIKQLVQSE